MSTDASGAPSEPEPRIAIVEFHDSILGGLRLQSGGDGVLIFEHLNVYIEESHYRYGVWSYRAELLLQGVEQLSLDKPLGVSDYISDGKVVDVEGREIQLASALRWTAADKVEMVFASSGGRLSLKVSNVQLSLTAALEKIEDWDGPLGHEKGDPSPS